MMKFLTGAVAALALTSAVAVTEAKAETTFAGSTQGCFGVACVPSMTLVSTGGLGFTGSNFQGTTSNNFLAIGGVLTNFGTFALGPQTQVYDGVSFTLRVTFTLPTGTTPGNTTTTALLTGSVSNLVNGGVTIDFDNTPMSFSFPGGGFTLTLNDISVFANRTQDINGSIRATPGPVAGAGLVALLGLAGAGFAARRRQQNAA